MVKYHWETLAHRNRKKRGRFALKVDEVGWGMFEKKIFNKFIKLKNLGYINKSILKEQVFVCERPPSIMKLPQYDPIFCSPPYWFLLFWKYIGIIVSNISSKLTQKTLQKISKNKLHWYVLALIKYSLW